MLEFILPNKEIDLDLGTDLLGYIPKADAILSLLQANDKNLKKLGMIALYGEWGSGKSSVMKYLNKNLDKKKFKGVFFEAWHHERDQNLPASLLDAIADANGNSSLSAIDTITIGKKFFKSLGKGLSLDFGVLKVDAGKIVEATENEIKDDFNQLSERVKLQIFKEKLDEAIKALKGNSGKIIVFIDDLDRCEPENVLNLLSSIKLFFTYGEDVVFFIGADKSAISKAVFSKYGDAIKADEYLEKIFDISFSMPQSYSVQKLISHYFPDREKGFEICDFFEKIKFTNPRHLKKVLNKYLVLCAVKDLGDANFNSLIPNIYKNEEGSRWETIFALYFIILHEFYPLKLSEIREYSSKITHYGRVHYNTFNRENSASGGRESLHESLSIQQVSNEIGIRNIGIASLGKISESATNPVQNSANKNNFLKLICLFTPREASSIRITNIDSIAFIKQFEGLGNNILVDFCKYLEENKNQILKIHSEYKFWDLFNMVDRVL